MTNKDRAKLLAKSTVDPQWAIDHSFEAVGQFHETFGHPEGDKPGLIPEDRAALRLSLIKEEYEELEEAVADGDIVAIADALGDLIYVVNGAAIEYGIDLPVIVAEIHRSNMTKLGDDGKPIYREDGKVLKGSSYEPPSLEQYL